MAGTFADDENSRLIYENAAYRAFVKLPQFRQFLRGKVTLESLFLTLHKRLAILPSALASKSDFVAGSARAVVSRTDHGHPLQQLAWSCSAARSRLRGGSNSGIPTPPIT